MGKITVVGLGAGDLEQLPLGIYRHLLAQNKIFVRTMDHPVIHDLEREGVRFHAFDSTYEEHDDFEQVYQSIVEQLLTRSGEGDLTYAVPGHPFVAERTVQLLVEKEKNHDIELAFLGGQSFLDAMYTALRIDPIEGCQIVDGTSLKRDEIELQHHLIIVQVYDAMIASEVKLTLMERLPDDYEVTIATAVGSREERLTTVPLYQLDHETTLNNLTAVYVPPVQEEKLLYGEFNKLRDVISILRGPDGCPWDQKQTHQSLKKYFLEEVHEALEAIDEEDDDHLIEELGDVLLQVMLHAQIGEDDGYFSIRDVIFAVTEKMIRRHPHVFGEVTVNDADEVVSNWDEIKKMEKGQLNEKESLLTSIPKGLPALMEANMVQKKAAKVGFDWDEVAPIWAKLQEELDEFLVEVKEGNTDKMEKELGDILFVVVNLARFYKIDSEQALLLTNHKFRRRFQYIEEVVMKKGKNMTDMSLTELDEIWEAAKKLENKN
ncbi:nucleoside triphosphate pyrophosphohydrolase [Halalkalibacter akibai]|uniref:Possible tetrapyrrole methyltransferase domain n=1 Tax=Halalkalibacter akibai (strain ATCC 43226 / DSM 21942 / CIP 109018 / JCM 9157 / 1139) TaxID=1236973 RepID=W4QZ41_HALA3|nr:nucleoside triphosphate pyrophosphohydrolase [Halalkalibacter akibai]GAE36574.1 possible tetrapyrrole methyltransferase domain [Halalkalibacter akibai JCM 9157]